MTRQEILDQCGGWLSPSIHDAMNLYAEQQAIEFHEWLRINTVADGAPKLLYKKFNTRKTTVELYKIFNLQQQPTP